MSICGISYIDDAEKEQIDIVKFSDYEVYAYKSSKNYLFDLLKRAFEENPKKIAVCFKNKAITYEELYYNSIQFGSVLKTKFLVGKGDRVALLIHNTIEFVISVFAICYIGAIICPLNVRLNIKELNYILDDCKAELLITEDYFINNISDLTKNIGIRNIVNIGKEKIAGCSIDIYFFKELLEKSSKSEKYDFNLDLNPYDTVLILYTSGTTSNPKGVKLSSFNIFNSVISYYNVLKINQYDTTLIAVPLFYVTGLIAQLFLFFYSKSTIYLMEKFHPSELLELISKYRISFFHSAAAIYNIVLQNKSKNDYDLSSLRLSLCGGGPSPLNMIKILKKWLPALDFRTVYGLTETSSPVSIYPDRNIMKKSNSCGIPIPVIEIKIINDDGRELDVNEIGEIIVKGGVVFSGYWNKKEETDKALKNGWFSTGDIGKIDKDGYLYILDRKKDVINRGGEKIYSIEVENVILQHPYVKDAAVIGVRDKIMGEEIKAFIVLEKQKNVTDIEIKEWVSNFLGKYKIPKFISFLNELPRNANGKIMKSLLRK